MPGVKKRGYNMGPYWKWGRLSGVKLCWPFCKTICSGAVSMCMNVWARERCLCVFLHLRKEFWDCDLLGFSWTGTSGVGGGSMTGVCSCEIPQRRRTGRREGKSENSRRIKRDGNILDIYRISKWICSLLVFCTNWSWNVIGASPQSQILTDSKLIRHKQSWSLAP